jgi:hypothetical protein
MNRKSILNVAAALFVAALPFATYTPAAEAQNNRTLAVVSIPFAFEAGSRHCEAGKYTVSLQGENFMVLHGASGSATSIVRWNDDMTPASTTRVVFHRYGNQYFLREVWDENAPSHLVNPETRAEARARKAQATDVAANHGAGANVEVAIAANRN